MEQMEHAKTAGWYWLAAIGLVAGTVSGALGVGSGIIIIPALVLGLGFPQKVAQGASLAVMAPMALMGAFRYWWNPDIGTDWRAILIIIPFAIIGANLGSSAAAWLPGEVLRKIFGVFIIIVGIRMLWSR